MFQSGYCASYLLIICTFIFVSIEG